MNKLVACLLLLAATARADGGWEDRRDAGELAVEQKNYAEAYRIYSNAIAQLRLPPPARRWADFRVADCRWREQATARQADPTKFNEAREALQRMVRDTKRAEDRDRTWAEVHESLGDCWWRGDEQNWPAAWANYQQALDWWAGQSDLPQARARYLAIAKKCAAPGWADRWYRYGHMGNRLPFEVVENVLAIAESAEDKAWAHYLVAVTAQQHGGGPNPNRVPQAFEAALAAGPKSRWHDDVLFQYAQWLERQGRAEITEEGALVRKPDYVQAATLYRRLLDTFKEGESQYRDQAKNALENIVNSALSVGVDSFFLPGSEIGILTSWRNVKRIEFTLYALDLVKDINLEGQGDRGWLEAINPSLLKKVHGWEKDTQDDGTHGPGQEELKLDRELAPGAYLLAAAGGGQTARELILVTESALALKTGGATALAWFCDAVTGEPRPGATVRMWQRYQDNNRNHWRLIEGKTGTNGLAALQLPEGGHETVVFASDGKRQALAAGHAWYGRAGRAEGWKIYAFTDRTAYRPGETVQWKFLARVHDGGSYTTPAGKKLTATVTDPRGATVLETNLTLNAFGSAWSELAVTDKMPLGEYQVQFQDGDQHVGAAVLFRLEEFKLPEFKVGVTTPEQDGRKATFLLGDVVEAEIQADYYSGGPVANASVQVVIRQQSHYRWWYPPCDFGWFYQDFQPQRHGWGDGNVVKQETIKTDAAGRARVKFQTQRSGQELEYTIEARVTDASRREIVGTGKVRVGNQRYFVYATPENRLRRPGQKAVITLRAQDANDAVLGLTGKVKVAKLVWKEQWISPLGLKVEGAELRAARAASAIWPPPPPADRPPWRCVHRAYEEKEIALQNVTIPTNGTAEFVFTPAEAGYYLVRWRSPQAGGAPVTAECHVWATTEQDADIGYLHAGGVEIVVDKDTFREGETAAVMLAAPASGRWVLFGVEGEDLYDYQVVKLDGAAKLVQLPVVEKHAPNIFLTAACFSDAQFSTDQKQVIVPPVKHYLSVTVTAERAAYQPGEQAKLRVTATDHSGKPVAAELALAVADEAVLYIQQDPAGDPREFFFGAKRGHQIQTWTTFNTKPLRRVVEEARDQDEFKEGAARAQVERFSDGGRVVMSKRMAERTGGAVSRNRVGMDLDELFSFSNAAELAPAPMAAMAMDAAAPAGARMLKEAKMEVTGDRGGAATEPVVVVRSDFRATALWTPDLVTDTRGRAEATVKLPDSLTSWQGKARVATKDNRFGIADVTFQARLPLTCRLQAPRFFVVGDTCTVSAVINNHTDEPLAVKAELAASGLNAEPRPLPPVTIPAHGETRVDWTVTATAAGPAKLTATAKGGMFGDAMEKTYVVHDHGIEKFIGASTKLRGEAVSLHLDLPAARRAETTALTVQVSPSIAASLLEALPYLANYPYGCTEQTMSRFLPAVTVAKTLKDLGIKPEQATAYVEAALDAGAATVDGGRTNTVGELDRMVKAGLDRLYDFQHADGGWGWWKEGGSDAYMTAYVLWGLALAKDSGIALRGDVAERGLAWLEKKLVESEDQPDLQAWELHALSAHRRTSRFASTALANLWEKRDGLNAYSKALFLLATVNFGDPNKVAPILARNLRDGVLKDDRPDASNLLPSTPPLQHASTPALPTARWGAAGGWWRWSDGPIESTAFVLKALLAVNPQDDLVEPAMNWLVKNRRGGRWSNTRDTAYAILALCDYLRVSRETATDLAYDVVVNGQKVASRTVTPDTALAAPAPLAVPRGLLRDGTNEVRVVRTTGAGPLYVSAFATFFSLEEPIAPAGHELFVKRQYFKIVPRPTLLKGVVYDKLPLNDGDAVRSGERIEVLLAVETKNDYAYLLFEDLKPAGFEAVELRSGGWLQARQLTEPAGRRRFSAGLHDVDPGDYAGATQGIYPEWRDRQVALFADRLDQGLWELRYELRAETPGRFHALPVVGHAMYVPEIRANSAEVRVTVQE